MNTIAATFEPLWDALARFFFADDAQERFLAGSIDHAYLVRRIRIYERGAPHRLFQ